MKPQNIVHGILIATSFIIAANSSLVCDLVDFNVPVLNGLFQNENAQSSFCTKKYEPGMEKLRPESEYYMTFNSASYMWDQTVEIYELDEYSVIEMGFYFNTKLGDVASYFDLVVISVIDLSTIIKIEVHTKPGWRIIQEIVNTTNVNARIQLYIGATAQMTFMVEYIKISNNHSGAQTCLIDTNTADSIISTIPFESTTENSSISIENTLPSIPTSVHFTSTPYSTTNYTPDESSISTPTDQNENHSTRSLDYSVEDSTITSLSDFTTGGSLTIIYDSNTASTMSDISTTHDISSVSTNIMTIITTDATTFSESNNISTDLSNLSSIIPSDSTVDSTTSTSMEFTNHSELQTALTDHGGPTTDSTNGYSTSSVYSTIFDISTNTISTKTTDTTIDNSSTVLVDSTTSNSVEFTNHSKPDDILTISLDSTDNVSELPTAVTDHSGLTTDNNSPIIVDSTNDSTNRYSTIGDISTMPSTSSKISDTTIDNSSTFCSTIVVDSTNSDFLTTPSGSTINNTLPISSDSTNDLTSVTADSQDSTTVETILYDSTILVNSTIFDYAISSDDSTALHDVSTVSSVSTESDISTISFDSINITSILPTDLTDTSVFLTNSTTESGSYLATDDISTTPPTFTTGTLDTTAVDSTFESAPIYSTTSNISKMPSDSTTRDISTASSDSTDNISIITSDSQDFSSTILLELTTTDSSIITYERVTVPVDSSTNEISTIPPSSTRNDRPTSDSVTYSILSTTLVDSTIFVESTTESSNPDFTGTHSTITFSSATGSASSTNWIEVDSTVTINSVTENITSIDHSFSVILDSTNAHSTISLSSTTESSTPDNRSVDTSNFTDQDDSNEIDTTPMAAQHLKSEESHVDIWMVVALLFMSLFCISFFVGLYVFLDIFRLVKSMISPKVNNQQSRNETHINMNDVDEERLGTSPTTLIPRLVVNRTPKGGVWIHKASLSPFDSVTSENSFMWHRNRRSEYVV